MVETTLSVAELEHDVGAALERVRGGERVVVERDGEPIAMIVPPPPRADLTWGEFVALLEAAPRPDPGFADDLADVQANQGLAEFPEWPD